MREFKDPTGLANAATIAVLVYMMLDIIYGLFSFLHLQSPPAVESGRFLASGLVGLLDFIAMVLCFILVGCWIHRASANAHVLSNEMTISPGWAVGSYFIPILNLFRPFQGMKEAWMASHYRHSWQGESAPGLLVVWWTLWIVVNILNNISFRLSLDNPDILPTAPILWLDVVIALLNLPLCLVLIRMMRELSRVQLAARHEETFA